MTYIVNKRYIKKSIVYIFFEKLILYLLKNNCRQSISQQSIDKLLLNSKI
jgi:hypothetical protein